MAVEIEKIESDHHDLGRSALQLVLQYRKLDRAIGCRRHHLAIDDRRPRADMPSIVGDLLEPLGPFVAAPCEHVPRLMRRGRRTASRSFSCLIIWDETEWLA